MAPRWIDDDQSNLTEFGEKYSELPDNVLQLDAVIEDLTEDLSGSVHNPQVIKKYQKVRLLLSFLLNRDASIESYMRNMPLLDDAPRRSCSLALENPSIDNKVSSIPKPLLIVGCVVSPFISTPRLFFFVVGEN